MSDKTQQQVIKPIYLDELIQHLQNYRNHVGNDLEVFWGAPSFNVDEKGEPVRNENGTIRKIMDYDLPDFFQLDTKTMVITGQKVVDDIIKVNKQKQAEAITNDLLS